MAVKRSLVLACAALAFTLLGLQPLLATKPAVAQAWPGCDLQLTRRLEPATLRLDEALTVRLEVQADCPDVPLPRRVVLALAPWPGAAEVTLVRQAVSRFLAELDFSQATLALVMGHVVRPQVVLFTDQPALLEAALSDYRPSAYGSDSATLLATAAQLFYGDEAPAGRGHILLLGHGRQRPSSEAGLANASFDARAGGVWLTSVCVGGGCQPIPRAEAIELSKLEDLPGFLASVAARPVRLALDQLVVTDELGGEAVYWPQSARPAASRIGETVERPGSDTHHRGFLEWQLDQETHRWSAEYRLRPLVVGSIRTHGRLTVEAVDTLGRWLQAELGEAWATVLPPPPAPARCRVYGEVNAEDSALLGETVNVSLKLSADCPVEPQQADVVLLVDRSWSTSGQALANLVQAGRDFLGQLNLDLVRAAVVVYNDRPEIRQPFTNDRRPLLAALDGLTAEGNTNPRAAIDLARQLLADGRAGALPVIVLLYDGFLTVDPRPAVEWARMEGIRIATVCFRSGVTCAGGIASPPEYAIEAEEPADLAAYWQRFVPSLVERSLEEIVVTQSPSAALRYSKAAAPASLDAPTVLADGRLRWIRSGLLRQDIHLAYALEAAAIGRWPLAEQLAVSWRERGGAVGAGSLPVPDVRIRAPDPAGPCQLLRAEREAWPSRVAVGSAITVTSKLDLECPPADMPLHVMLVIDHSASMGAGTGRLAAVQRAVRAMLEASTSQQWLFGLVAFNDSVTEWLPITENRDQLLERVERLRPSGGTNIAAGIARGGQLLAEAATDVPQVMIVLSDGVNSAGSAPVLAAADVVKAAGVILVTVCAGGQCDAALPAAASNPSYYFDVPDPEGIVALFVRLGYELIRTVTTMRATEAIAPGMVRSSHPVRPPAESEADDAILWSFDVLPVGGVSLEHQLLPQRPGRQPVALWMLVEYTTRGRGGQLESGRFYLSPPVVEVFGGPTSPPGLPTLVPPPPADRTPEAAPHNRLWLPALRRGS